MEDPRAEISNHLSNFPTRRSALNDDEPFTDASGSKNGSLQAPVSLTIRV